MVPLKTQTPQALIAFVTELSQTCTKPHSCFTHTTILCFAPQNSWIAPTVSCEQCRIREQYATPKNTTNSSDTTVRKLVGEARPQLK